VSTTPSRENPPPATPAPQKFICPICNAPWRGSSNLCASCGADLYDPDVQAFASGQAPGTVALGTDDLSREAHGDAAGMLGAGKVVGVSLDGLTDGSAMRRLGLIGGFMLAVAFVLPALRLWEWEPPLRWGDDPRLHATLRYSWDLLKDGNAVALLYPLVAAFAGLAVAWVPRIPAHVRASLLGFFGLSGLVLCLGQLGSYGMAPTKVATLATLGVVLAGVAMAARVLEPQSMPARWGLVGAAVVFTLGMVIPVADLSPRLPFDYSFDWLDVDMSNALPLTAIAKGVDRRAMGVFFVAVWLLLPLVLIPAAAALSWKRPRGVWDKDGLALRPMAWVMVLYLPLLYGLMAFSASGWEDQLSKSAMLGRMRLCVVVLPLSLWAQFGFLGAIVSRRPAAKPAGADRAASGAALAG
jgi:hypothetical protein